VSPSSRQSPDLRLPTPSADNTLNYQQLSRIIMADLFIDNCTPSNLYSRRRRRQRHAYLSRLICITLQVFTV